MDRFVRRQIARHATSQPEYRLFPLCLAGIVLPSGLFLYGWSAQLHWPWPVPVIGTGVFGIGVAVCQIASAAYLVDAFGTYAASAVAASMALRFLASGVLPLAGPPMYDSLGWGWGTSVLGFTAVGAVPMPMVLMKYGARLRRKYNKG